MPCSSSSGRPRLRQVAAEQHEVGLRIERVDVLDRLDRALHEALVERAHIHVRVGDIGEGKWRRARRAGRARVLVRGRVGDVDELKGMRRHQTLGHHGAGARAKDLQEGAAIEPAQSAQHLVAIFHVLGFDALVPCRHGSLPLRCCQSPPSSAGFSSFCAGVDIAERSLETGTETALAHRGRLVALRPVGRDRVRCFSSSSFETLCVFRTGQGREKSNQVVFFGFGQSERQRCRRRDKDSARRPCCNDRPRPTSVSCEPS